MSALTLQQQNNLKQAAFSAIVSEQMTAVPSELTVAQWALESGWGAHQPGNNCFGIKAYKGCFGTQMLTTTEYVSGKRHVVELPFATFPSLAACFEKHALLFTASSLYRSAWENYRKLGNLRFLVESVGIIYATAPDYADTIWSIIEMPAVKAAIAACRNLGDRTH